MTIARKDQYCGNCNAFYQSDAPPKGDQPQQGWCCRNPPVVMQTMVAVGSSIERQGPRMAPALQGVQPPSNARGWCGAWKEDDR